MSLDFMARFVAFLMIVALLGCHSTARPAGYADKPELSALMNAAAHNDLPRIHTLLGQGADVRERTKQGETALYEAIERRELSADNLPTVDALLKAGSDPNEIEIFGVRALEVSLSRDYANPAVTLLLLRSGASVRQDCDQEHLLVTAATQESSLEVIQALIAEKAQVNCQDRNGWTALHWAALNGQADRVALLLQNGADPKLRTKGGQTPLDEAKTSNSESRVQAEFAKTRELLRRATSSRGTAE
jgi:ankyrin repeat protein